jgi:protein-tyrosine kinase
MSRIDEALRRARQGARPTAVEPPAEPALSEPAREGAPWVLDTDSVEAAPVAESARDGAPWALDTEPVEAAPPAEPLDPPGDARQPAGRWTGFGERVAEKLIVGRIGGGTPLEEYRRLAATLHHAQADRQLRVLMIASAAAGEGKTLTATNLALTFSESYKRRVLLIDADLRRPSLHEVFQLPNVSGLSDGLHADTERKLPIIEVSPHLSVLTAGRPEPDPMSLLTSDRMRRVLEEAAAAFDWVIVDTPPVALLPDANLLAAMVDAAVVVIGAEETPFDLVQRAVDAIGRERVLGVVLNKITAAGGHAARGYGYGYGYDYGYSRSSRPRH